MTRKTDYPRLQTDRLVLDAFTQADAPTVQRLAGHPDIAATTLRIPHPYEDGMAEEWIATHAPTFEQGSGFALAIRLRGDASPIGAIGLTIDPEHEHAELGYWVGRPFWGHGYCTEAAGAVLHYGFATLGLNRIHAYHFGRNPASGRVMEKVGMVHEGCRRQHVKKWGMFEDLEMYAILKAEYEHATRAWYDQPL